MPFALLAASTALIVLATALPLSRSPKWWIRDWDFPRLQLAIVGFALLAVQICFLDLSALPAKMMVAATAACTLYQAWWIVPYTRLFPVEVLSARDPQGLGRIRILAANVLTPNRNAEGLVALIREHRPDIFVTLESDAWWEEQLDQLADEYSESIRCPLDNLYGMHVYSRLPLEHSETQFLMDPDIPSMHTTVVLGSGQRVQMHFLHPAPPSPTENEESAQRDIELLVIARRVAGLDIPVVVAGDLNDVAWSWTTRLFRKISGLLDPRVGRGMCNTFHAGHWFLRWPLDHLFHSRHFTLSFIRRLPDFGSDHFPVLVELICDPSVKNLQSGLEPDAEDEEAARKKLAQRDVKRTGTEGRGPPTFRP